MDSLGSLNAFVQAAETRSFTVAGRQLGVSSSAIGKAVARMEERLGVRFVQDCTLSLSLKRFDAVGDRNPALRTLHPDEVAWSEPTRVIKSAGFEGKHVLCRLQNMIDADSALGTEHTRNLVAAVGGTRKLLRQAGHCQAVFRHRHGHAEGAAGLALAFFAVAGSQAYWFRRQYVTH
jgi:Bacterial regulatory helix-turn-helix protein, lysR family